MVATSIEQSKELLRLGLPADSADMSWYDIEYNNPCKNDWVLMFGYFVNSCPKFYIPAWSLSALLEVMPDKLTDGRYHYYLESDLKSEIYYKAIGAPIPNKKGYTLKANMFDAAFEMVRWLLQMEIINK
jgi:hypothetical protein